MTKWFLNKNERRFEPLRIRRILTFVTSRMSLGLSADQWQRNRHLPQTQEEEESYQQSHHGDAVTQEVYDHCYLVVHLAFFLQEEKKHEMSLVGAFDLQTVFLG